MPGFTQAKHIVYQSEREVRRALIQVGLYVCFLIATTIIALSSQHGLVFYFNQAMERGFLSYGARTKGLVFKDIVTIPEWWDFLEKGFLRDFHNHLGQLRDVNQNAETDKKKDNRAKRGSNKNKRMKREKIDVPEGVRALIISDNILLGAVKMRQIRVRNDSCKLHEKFEKFFKACYADYSFGKEDRQVHYKNTRYYSRDEYKATPIFGSFLKYDGPGYMIFLSYEKTENLKLLEKLVAEDWIDIATRAVIIEFVVYNSVTHLFNNVKLMAEVLPTGGILPNFQMTVMPLYTIWSPNNFKTLISAIVFYLLVVFYTSVEIQELLKEGFRDYFGNAQNYVDITILLTAYLALTLTMMHPFKPDTFISLVTKNPHSLASLDEACFWYEGYVYVMAVCVFMVWAKIFRFVGFNKTLLQFSTTLRRCLMDIIGFAVMFFIVFIAFALVGNMVFGSSNPDFSTFHSALFAMVRMVLGDFPYERIEKANRVLGPIFCLTYVLLITFILLNMFLAIINETYSAVKLEIRDDHSALKNFVVNIGQKMRNCLTRLFRSSDDPYNKKNDLSSSSGYRGNQDDTKSMFEYADIPLSSLGIKGKTQSKHRVKAKGIDIGEEEDAADEYSLEVLRLTERAELMEDIVKKLSKNMDRLFGRLNQNAATPRNPQ